MKAMTKSIASAKRLISQFAKGLARKAWLPVSILAGIVGTVLIGLLLPAFLAARKLTRRPAPDPPADPAALGLPYEEASFLTEDGLTLRGWFIPAPVPARGTILFCHGHSGSMDGDLGYVPALHQHGYNVLMFDFRAHGRSEGRHVSMGFHERKDVLAAVRFLESKGIHEVGLLGFSMGGATAIITAPLAPAVKAVVTDSAFATLDTTVAGGLRVKGIPEPIPRLVGKLAIKIAAILLARRLEDAYPIRWVHQAAPRGLFIIHGEADIYVPVEDARRLYALAGEPKQLWVAPGAGHREIDQVAPGEYLPNILAFFDRFFPSASESPGQGEGRAKNEAK